jgi:hypothetical protein
MKKREQNKHERAKAAKKAKGSAPYASFVETGTHPRLIVGRFSVGTKTTHDVDGSPASDGRSCGDSLSHYFADDKYKLADLLEELAREVRATNNDFDGGRAQVFILRSYSSAARKRLGG